MEGINYLRNEGSVPDSREARRRLEVRREQARTEAGGRHAFATGLRQLPAITWHDGALYIVMNNRDQLDVVLAGQVHGEGQRRASRRADVPRGAGLELRLAVLLLRLRQKKFLLNPEYGGDGKEVGRCTRVHACRSRPSPPTGRRSTDVLQRHAVPEEVSGRRVHRVPRIVESRADAAGRLQRHVPAVRGRQAVGRVRGFRATASPARIR